MFALSVDTYQWRPMLSIFVYDTVSFLLWSQEVELLISSNGEYEINSQYMHTFFVYLCRFK